MPVNYGKFAKKDLEPEVVAELEKLSEYLEIHGAPQSSVEMLTRPSLAAPERRFNSKVGPLSVLTFGAPNPEIGARAVRRIRKKLAKAYPDMKQPEETKV